MEHAAGIAALGIDWKILVAQLVNFLILYFLLSKFAFGPLIKMLESRRKNVEVSEKTVKAIEQEKAKLDETVKTTVAKAKKEAQTIIAASQKSMKEEIATAKKESEARSAKLLADTKQQIEAMKKETKAELSREIGMLVVQATQRVIESDLSQQEKDTITSSIVKEVESDK